MPRWSLPAAGLGPGEGACFEGVPAATIAPLSYCRDAVSRHRRISASTSGRRSRCPRASSNMRRTLLTRSRSRRHQTGACHGRAGLPRNSDAAQGPQRPTRGQGLPRQPGAFLGERSAPGMSAIGPAAVSRRKILPCVERSQHGVRIVAIFIRGREVEIQPTASKNMQCRPNVSKHHRAACGSNTIRRRVRVACAKRSSASVDGRTLPPSMRAM
jgi:hypothetical protein